MSPPGILASLSIQLAYGAYVISSSLLPLPKNSSPQLSALLWGPQNLGPPSCPSGWGADGQMDMG